MWPAMSMRPGTNMINRRFQRVFAWVFLFGVVLPAMAAPRPAPDFKLSGMDGKPVELKAYRGKLVILNFWATWCPPCLQEVPDLVDFYQQHGEDAVVIGLAVDDDAKEIKEFIRVMDVTYPVAISTDAINKKYGGILSLPITFFIDRKGRIVTQQVGIVTRKQLEQFVSTGKVTIH